MKLIKMESAMKTEINTQSLFHRYNNHLEWLACIGEPMLYDTELYVLRRKLEPGIDTYRWYKGIRVA